ncbi:AlpA family transcriptional regulator [Vibrio cholerae]|uniref:AlpA family transcriptional regulator n=1 Tax=Vibrio cholerae TaxID=666 RepID=UPI001F088F51|nr:AlpA family transcriptional regulator [Vibrio cholerae]
MRFLKLKEVMEKTALSRSAIYRKMNDGEFPQSVSLGERAIAWVESEVDECSGQLKLATVLEFSQYNRSDSLGVRPPLY